MSRPVVLIVGRRGPTAARLRAQLARRGMVVRTAGDCGEGMEVLALTTRGAGGAGGQAPIQAVVLDLESAGVGARAFREMIQQEFPGVSVLELPPEGAGPEDVGLLVGAVEQSLRGTRRAAGAEPEADERFEGPLHGYKFEDLNSRSARMLDLFQLIPRVAQTDSPVLIVGETGTGKELVAAAIHRQSRRRENEFFTVNCGALTETLLESELFGHEKGAFTGAIRTKKGYFELADRGTLFLDELGTISPAMQVKLLRVLQQMEVRRVGGSTLQKVDVRIVAATNASLEEAVARGTFREDLYYRLNVVQISLPALRERAEDIPLLAEVFRKKFCDSFERPDITHLTPAALRWLKAYPWPGNVRELENVIERAVILCRGPGLGEDDLPERLRRSPEQPRTTVPTFDLDEPLPEVLRRVQAAVEREYIRRLLRRFKGHLGRAAEHAGVNRRTLYNKMQAFGLRREDFRAG